MMWLELQSKMDWNFEDKWKWEFLYNYHSTPVSDSGWNPSYDNLQMHENQKFDNSIILHGSKRFCLLLIFQTHILEQIAFQLPLVPSN